MLRLLLAFLWGCLETFTKGATSPKDKVSLSRTKKHTKEATNYPSRSGLLHKFPSDSSPSDTDPLNENDPCPQEKHNCLIIASPPPARNLPSPSIPRQAGIPVLISLTQKAREYCEMK